MKVKSNKILCKRVSVWSLILFVVLKIIFLGLKFGISKFVEPILNFLVDSVEWIGYLHVGRYLF